MLFWLCQHDPQPFTLAVPAPPHASPLYPVIAEDSAGSDLLLSTSSNVIGEIIFSILTTMAEWLKWRMIRAWAWAWPPRRRRAPAQHVPQDPNLTSRATAAAMEAAAAAMAAAAAVATAAAMEATAAIEAAAARATAAAMAAAVAMEAAAAMEAAVPPPPVLSGQSVAVLF